ncbi:MAG: hypothetical protein NZL98_07030 [Anaerolineales bacterium]|nr:hypothetical protein [Anaerolineales bacterium]
MNRLPVIIIFTLFALACELRLQVDDAHAGLFCAAYYDFLDNAILGVEPYLLGLDLYIPANAQNAPMVMWVHGGDYVVGNQANQTSHKITLFNTQGGFCSASTPG